MEQATSILMYISLIAFNFFAWYVLWEEGSRMFDSKNFNLAAASFFITNMMISKLDDKVMGDIYTPFTITLKVVLFVIFIYIAYLGYKKGKVKYKTSEEI